MTSPHATHDLSQLLLPCAALLALAGCPSEATDNPFTSAEEIGDGDGDGDPTEDSSSSEETTDTTEEETTETTEETGEETETGDPPDPTCDDGIKNQDETDVDCGGFVCGKCAEGLACNEAKDCVSNMCVGDLCVTGCLGDPDCDYLDEPCKIGICNIGVCEQYDGNDGADCVTGELCKQNGECVDGECIEEELDCTDLDSDCTQGVCDQMSGECVSTVVNEGLPCTNADGCTIAPTCLEGVCQDPNAGALFYEPFADNMAGWTLDTNWQIGPAVAGCGDPGQDHTPTADNGVAGVVLGGCAPTPIHPFYCLTSPAIDTSGLPSVWMTYYRDLWSDYTPYMKNKIEVFNGNTWVILFETFGSPGVDDANWSYFAYDVTAHANPQMQFRWCYNIQSGGVFSRGSWNVDDVTVSVTECNGAD